MEQHLAAAQPALGHRRAQGGGRLVVERAEQRSLTEYVVVHGSSSSTMTRRRHGCRTDPIQWHRSQAHRRRKSGRGAPPGLGCRRCSPYAGAACRRRARPRPAPRLVRRARKIDRVLAETYPDARCELDFDDPFQLLVVTVLSAQTTDRRVNAVRPTLFAAYPDPAAMAAADRASTWSRSSARSASSGPRPSRCSSFAPRWWSGYDGAGARPARGPGHAARAWAARPPTSCSATPSASRASPSTPTSAGWSRRFGWTEETDPVKVEHASARCSRSATGRCSATT